MASALGTYTNIAGSEKKDEEKGEEKKSFLPSMKRSKTVDKSSFERSKDFVATLTDTQADSPWKQALACFLKYLMKPLIVVCMIYIWIGKKLYIVYKMLPMNIVYMIFGVGLCFFGGVYFTTIAAAEAFRSFGGEALWEELCIVWEEAKLANEASQLDDKVDANKDNIPDVEQMSANELVSHKAKVALAAVKDPERLMLAIQYLFSAYLSVIATLKMQFAKYVALALGIASMLDLPATRCLGPVLAMVMGKDIQHWIPAIISGVIKVIAVIVATFIQSIISAFYSGLRGGKIFAESLISMLGEAGIMDKCPDWLAKKPFDANESYLDEAIGYPLAAFGFYYQLSNAMMPAFPFSLMLLPLTVVEYILRWQVFT
mmetsp:Transcript_65828/g.212346  ORF Transcript_65828/g.212346 Transcript_65828/m.212346 type:complete len:373 (-) Transcript_65828:58-1176(-)